VRDEKERMMGRKTVNVEDVLAWANNYMASPSTTPESRKGVAALIEQVLHSTGNYAGFNLLVSEYLPAEEQTLDNVLREGYDDTRRRYHGGKVGK
jgi:hypothetical protein